MQKTYENKNMGTILISRYFSGVIFFITVALVSGTTSTHDYIPYMNNYYGYINSNFEVGYDFVSNLSKNLGLSFDLFKLVILGMGMILIRSTAKKFLPKSSLWKFYFIYMIFPMTMDAAAIRNTLSMVILIYSIPYLADTKMISIFKFIALILIASLFHKAALFYFILLSIKIYDNRHKLNKKIIKGIFGFVLLNGGLLILNRGYLEFVLSFMENILISNEFITTDKLKYFSILGNYGFLLFFIYQLISIFSINFVQKLNTRSFEKDNCNNIEKEVLLNKLIKYVLFINILLLILVPFYRVNSNFFRIYRNIIPINHMAILSMFRFKRIQKTNKYLIFLVYLAASILLAYIEIEPMKELAFYTLFTDNWIFNLMR